MKRLCSVGVRYVRSSLLPFSQTRPLASKVDKRYPKNIFFSDPFQIQINDAMPRQPLVLPDKEAIKPLLPLREESTDAVVVDPSSVVSGRTYFPLRFGAEYALERHYIHLDQAAKQAAVQAVAEDLARSGVRAEILLDRCRPELMSIDDEPIMQINGIVRTGDRVYIIKHTTVLTMEYCTSQHSRMRKVKEAIDAGAAVSHSDMMKGVDMHLVLAGELVKPEGDRPKLQNWAVREGVTLFLPSGADWSVSYGPSIAEASPV